MIDRVIYVTDQPVMFVSGSAGITQQLGDIEDTATMHLRLQEGVPVNLLAAWCPQGEGIDDELTLYGTDGTLRVWAWRGWCFEPADGPAEGHNEYNGDDDLFVRVRTGMRGALSEFAAAVTGGRSPSPGSREILNVQRIVERFYELCTSHSV